MKKWVIISLLVLMPILQGCGLAVLSAGIGYGIGQGRKGKAKIVEQYNGYKLGMEKINIERESKNLEIKPILTFKEWLKTQR